MSNIVDRRGDSDKRFTTSRERFMTRNRRQIKEAIDKAIANTDIKNIGKGGVDVTVPQDGLKEPFIHHGNGGQYDKVVPGNQDMNVGDRINKPKGGGGGGNQPGDPGDPSDGDDGQDDFIFTLTEEEFLNILYEDLELPNLTKRAAEDTKVTKPKRAGFVTDGSPNKLDLTRSKSNQLKRHFAHTKPRDRKILEALQEQYAILLGYDPDYKEGDEKELARRHAQTLLSKKIDVYHYAIDGLLEKYGNDLSDDDKEALNELGEQINALEEEKGKIPKWNDLDLIYRHHEQKPTPTTQAVMFCMMDVSGSMDQHKKSNAKLFYMLLYRFLKRNYDQVDIVFVRHTTHAEEVDEETFFYDTLSGGTTVSTVIEKMGEIIDQRYSPSEWNIYGAQASDGENWGDDNNKCVRLIQEELNSRLQAYFYTEVTWPNGYSWGESLAKAYKAIEKSHPEQFFMGEIKQKKDIWPIFRSFFHKKEGANASPAAMTPSP